jgi:hypothetical protein
MINNSGKTSYKMLQMLLLDETTQHWFTFQKNRQAEEEVLPRNVAARKRGGWS